MKERSCSTVRFTGRQGEDRRETEVGSFLVASFHVRFLDTRGYWAGVMEVLVLAMIGAVELSFGRGIRTICL